MLGLQDLTLGGTTICRRRYSRCFRISMTTSYTAAATGLRLFVQN